MQFALAQRGLAEGGSSTSFGAGAILREAFSACESSSSKVVPAVNGLHL